MAVKRKARPENKRSSKELKCIDVIKDVLRRGPLTTTQIYQRIKISREYVSRILLKNPSLFVCLQTRVGRAPSIYALVTKED